MRLISSSSLVALSSYAILASALPFWSQQAVERSLADSLAKRKVAYSVVPVDGGLSSSTPPETKTEETTKTVTQPASTLPPTTRTIVSTFITTLSDVETTIIVTTTQCASCATDAPHPPPSPSTTIAAPVEATTTAYSQTTVTSAMYVPSGDVTVTASQPTSTTTYDDGMYHTTWSTWNSTAYAPTATSSCSDALPTISLRTGTPANPTEVPVKGYSIDESRPSSMMLRRNMNNRKPSPISEPHLPRLPKTVSEDINPTEIPTIDVSKLHIIPGDRR